MKFELLAVRGASSPQSIRVEAESAESARASLVAQGYSILGATGRSPRTIFRDLALRIRRPAPIDLTVFCAQLTVLLRAGLSLPESLTALQRSTAKVATQETLAAIGNALRSGLSFSSALGTCPLQFPILFVSMMRAAERTSNLPEALERYLDHARQADALRAKARAAMVYPTFLVAMGGAVVIFLLLYVVPRFAGVYESMRAQLPWAARAMLAWSQMVREHSPLLLLVAATLTAVTALAISRPAMRGAILRQIHRIPRMGAFFREVHLARLYRTLAMLLHGGISLRQSLVDCADQLPLDLREQVGQCIDLIGQGIKVSSAFAQTQLVTPVSETLLMVGERSGELARMLEESAVFLELRTAATLERAMRLMEPIIMAVIGLTIGVIVVLMYMPIFELAGSLQ